MDARAAFSHSRHYHIQQFCRTSNDHYACLLGRDENLIPDNENHSNRIYEFESFSDKPRERATAESTGEETLNKIHLGDSWSGITINLQAIHRGDLEFISASASRTILRGGRERERERERGRSRERITKFRRWTHFRTSFHRRVVVMVVLSCWTHKEDIVIRTTLDYTADSGNFGNSVLPYKQAILSYFLFANFTTLWETNCVVLFSQGSSIFCIIFTKIVVTFVSCTMLRYSRFSPDNAYEFVDYCV